jgi:predicted dehydrogenase
MSRQPLDRREFLAAGAGLAAAAIASPRSVLGAPRQARGAPSSPRGANDRIGIGIVGCGSRGTYLLNEAIAADAAGIEIVGLCDVWSVARDRLAGVLAEKLPTQRPKLVARHEDLLRLPGLDAVVIATPDFGHPAVLIDAIAAGKDAFVEKPLSARLEDAVAAFDAVEKSDRIVQVGTQRRSSPRFRAAAEYVKSGALGPICKVETAWNRNVASWARPVDMIKPGDVDWTQYQMYLPKRDFDPVRYRCWQWYYEYTTGLVGLLGSHMIDVALWFMDDPFPSSAVALGGRFTWKDGRETSDTAEYVFDFPKGWMLTFSSRLGSGPESDFEVFYGKERTLDSRDWVSRPAAHTRGPGATEFTLPKPVGKERSHVGNWIDCMRTRRTPNAPIQAGYAHAVACCLGREAERTGRRVRYDVATRRILET